MDKVKTFLEHHGVKGEVSKPTRSTKLNGGDKKIKDIRKSYKSGGTK